jgi:hypothetical protein
MAIHQNYAVLSLLQDAAQRLPAYATEFADAQAKTLALAAAEATGTAIKKLSKALARQLDTDNP